MLHMVIFYYIIFRINETKYCTYLQYIDFIKLNIFTFIVREHLVSKLKWKYFR